MFTVKVNVPIGKIKNSKHEMCFWVLYINAVTGRYKKKKTLFLISYYERSDAVYTDNSQMYLLF